MLTDDSKKVLLSRLENVDEGYKRYAYDDATGNRVKAPQGNLTIGIGFNLDCGCPQDLARIIAYYFIDQNDIILSKCISSYNKLDQIRQIVCGDILFNLGFSRFAKFKDFMGALEELDYSKAAEAMKNSLWHQQLESRVDRLAQEMESGHLAGDG